MRISKPWFKFLSRFPARNRRLYLLVFAISFVLLGILTLAMSQAGVFSINSEAEGGTVNGPASIVDDDAASGDKAVRFNEAPVDPGPGGGQTINVSTAAQLTSALAAAKPGDIINMADGTYSGNFVGKTSGTANAPITLKGSRNAILNGGSIKSGYTMQLGTKNSAAKVSYWKLTGFTITGGQKGLIFDNVQRSIIDNLYVHQIGHEAVHLRNFSSDNVISNNTITQTGRDTQAYGEGIYIGTAVSNWDTFSRDLPDHSNNNQIIGNKISFTGAENMDIKEGTHGGLIKNNTFDGSGMCWDTSASCNFGDSMIDMKGEGWTIEGNTLSHMHATWENGGQTNDGIQVHVISNTGSEGSGSNNTFISNNISDVGGYGFNIQKTATGVVVKCNNTVTGAGQGFGNVTCTQ